MLETLQKCDPVNAQDPSVVDLLQTLWERVHKRALLYYELAIKCYLKIAVGGKAGHTLCIALRLLRLLTKYLNCIYYLVPLFFIWLP